MGVLLLFPSLPTLIRCELNKWNEVRENIEVGVFFSPPLPPEIMPWITLPLCPL